MRRTPIVPALLTALLAWIAVAGACGGNRVARGEESSPAGPGAVSQGLVGRWALVQLVRNGEDRTNPAAGTRYYTFRDDGSFSITRGDSVLESGTWSQDTTARPRIFDHIPNVNGRPGQYITGIFAIEADTLRISIIPPSPERRRPTLFQSSAGDRSWLLVYVRAAAPAATPATTSRPRG